VELTVRAPIILCPLIPVKDLRWRFIALLDIHLFGGTSNCRRVILAMAVSSRQRGGILHVAADCTALAQALISGVFCSEPRVSRLGPARSECEVKVSDVKRYWRWRTSLESVPAITLPGPLTGVMLLWYNLLSTRLGISSSGLHRTATAETLYCLTLVGHASDLVALTRRGASGAYF
jgi:hypothetical protein